MSKSKLNNNYVIEQPLCACCSEVKSSNLIINLINILYEETLKVFSYNILHDTVKN